MVSGGDTLLVSASGRGCGGCGGCDGVVVVIVMAAVLWWCDGCDGCVVTHLRRRVVGVRAPLLQG